MTDFVRVKLDNGSEATLSREFAEAKRLTILDKPAVDARGEALSAKHQANLAPSSKYGGMKPEELAEEAANRGLTVTGTGKDGNVLKADLVAALDAHDAETGQSGSGDS